MKATIVSEASAHVATAAGAVVGHAAIAPDLKKQVLEFYGKNFMERFSAEREQEVYGRYTALKQNTVNLSA